MIKKDVFNREPKIGDSIAWGVHSQYRTLRVGKIERFSKSGIPICYPYKVEPYDSDNIVLDTRRTCYPTRQDKAFVIINDLQLP